MPKKRDHRNAECGDAVCIARHAEEMSLGLPEDADERSAFYEQQRMLYLPWNQNTFCPNWTLAEGKCRNCEAETLVVRAGKMNLCVMWCLNSGAPLYPSGDQRPKVKDFLRHAKTCKKSDASTLHSWSLTSNYSEALKTAFMFSSPTKTKTLTSKSTSSLTAKAKTDSKSSSPSHLPNLVLSSRQ